MSNNTNPYHGPSRDPRPHRVWPAKISTISLGLAGVIAILSLVSSVLWYMVPTTQRWQLHAMLTPASLLAFSVVGDDDSFYDYFVYRGIPFAIVFNTVATYIACQIVGLTLDSLYRRMIKRSEKKR